MLIMRQDNNNKIFFKHFSKKVGKTKKLKKSHQIGTSLGPNQDKENNTI